jgi:hypothetical protein
VLQLAGDAGMKASGSRRQETPAERAVREARVAHEQVEQQRIRDAAIAAELAEESDKARAIIAETIDWDGSPAWRNWHAVRAIPEAAADRSAVLRWHPARRALVAIATDPAGVPTSGQMIMVRPDGTNVARRSGKKTKLTIGRPTATNAVVRLPGDASKPLVIAEGPENADSVAAPSGCEAWASLGPIPRIEPPGGRDVIVLSDGDDPDKPAAIDLEAWVAKWRTLGRHIVIARPCPEWTGHKYDFNDLLREQGPGAVLDRIAVARIELREQHIAELAAQKLTPADPPFPLPTATAAEVKAATFHAVQTFFMQRGIQPPVRIVVPGQTGSGKTEAVGQLLPYIIAADKADRLLPGSREGAPYRAVIMVPAHRLGRQIAERYEALGLSVAILEGRGDPWRPEKPSRPYLCRNLEAVGLALLAKQDVRSAVCGKANGKRCPFFDGCGYLAQFNHAHDADVLIVAHEFLFEQLPKSVLHDVAYVIIEEDFIPTGDAINDFSVDVFRPHSIGVAPALDRHGEADEEKTADLLRYSTRITTMVDGEPDGYLADDAPDRHHVTPSDARYLRYLHWKRQRNAQMHPGMSLAERREAQHHAAINQQLPRISAMMHMLENGEASRIRLTTDNKGRRSIVLHGRRTVARWLSDKPVLMLNATARLADVQRFFPTAIMVDLPQARMPFQRVHQILGSFGKSAMTDSKVADLVAEACAHAAGKAVLVICHEQCEAAFKAIPGVRTLHHGNYAGDDDHGDVDVIMHIGGPFAAYRKIAEIATARTGQAVPIVQPIRRACTAVMEDGTGVQFERMAYEHPAAQAVHEAIYDQAFVQGGLGRGRGINRSVTTPLEIFVYGNVPLPVPLASLSRWQPNRERMLLADRGTHSNARDLFHFCGDAFPNEEAAAKWRQRNPFDEDRIRILIADDPRSYSKVTWQPNGQGQKVRRSIVPTVAVGALRRAALSSFRAGLRSWQVEQLTAGELAPLPSAAPIGTSGECPGHLKAEPPSKRPARDWQGETRDHPPDG